MNTDNSKFYVIQKWMINKLNLKGLDLLIYAIIYGYSQDGDSEFFGSLTYLSEMTGSTKRGVIKSLSNLLENGYIFKNEIITNNIKCVKYSVNTKKIAEMELSSLVVNSVQYPVGGELSSSGVVNSVHGGGELSTPNNIDYNIYDKKKCNKGSPQPNFPTNTQPKLRNRIPPTVEEVAQYCLERNNGIDAEEFCDFYKSKGWKVGKEPMHDWQASVRTWERNHKKKSTSEKTKPQKTYGENEIPLKAAKWLSNKIHSLYPSIPEVNDETLQQWASEFDNFIKDGHEPSELSEVMHFVIQDDFWKSKISSPSDLIKHYVKIMMKAESEGWFN